MKTIFIGDIHGRSVWKLIINREKPDRAVFIGDYFDSSDGFTAAEQIHNFKEIIEYKKNSGIEVILLIGNHDYHYFSGIGSTSTSGYQFGAAAYINQVIEENKSHLQMAYQIDDIVCSHAGISIEWCKNNLEQWDNLVDDINELWKYKPLRFGFNGLDPYGGDTYQTPIWIRPFSLKRVNRNTFRTQIIQIVGHTAMNSIDIKGMGTGGRYYFIDTLGTSGEYLIYEDKKFYTETIRNDK